MPPCFSTATKSSCNSKGYDQTGGIGRGSICSSDFQITNQGCSSYSKETIWSHHFCHPVSKKICLGTTDQWVTIVES